MYTLTIKHAIFPIVHYYMHCYIYPVHLILNLKPFLPCHIHLPAPYSLRPG